MGWKLFFVQVIEHLSSSVMGFTITWSWVVHIYEGSHVQFNYEIAKFSIEPLKLFRETENLLWDQLVLLLIRSNQKFCLWKSTKQFFTHLFITLPQNPVLLRMDPNTIWDKKPRKHFSTHLGIYLKFQFFLCQIFVCNWGWLISVKGYTTGWLTLDRWRDVWKIQCNLYWNLLWNFIKFIRLNYCHHLF